MVGGRGGIKHFLQFNETVVNITIITIIKARIITPKIIDATDPLSIIIILKKN
jgi:hypothetical protein